MTLADGRKLAYAQHGSSTGKPLVVLHGTPGGRVQAQPMDAIARSSGVRVIAPDRPGCGHSDPMPDLSFTRYAGDVRQLLDHLKIQSAVIAGISGGGGFALACAHQMPQRASRVVLVSAMVSNPTSWRKMLPAPNRLLFFLAAHWPGLAAKLMQASLNVAPDSAMARRAIAQMPEADRRVMQRPEIRELFFGAAARDAMRQGPKAAVHELALYTRPPGFELGDIKVPVSLIHGDADTNVPLCVAEYVAAQIPGATLKIIPGAAHLFIIEQPERLLELV